MIAAQPSFGEMPLLLDGGLATELEARGCDISGALWSARVLQDGAGGDRTAAL